MTDTKAVLITGVCGGIGRSLAEVFAENNWLVIGTDRRVPDFGTDHFNFLRYDLEDIAIDDSIRDGIVNEVRQKLGEIPLKALVNNGALQILGKTEALTAEDFLRSFKANTLAPFRLAQGFLSDLETAKGAVINIGTVHAQSTKPEFVAYATTKTALHGLTRALAVDLGSRVRVCGLAPAATETPMLKAGFEGNPEAFKALSEAHPLQRIAAPAEIARLVEFLASEKAAFIHGETLYADGGVLSRLHDPL